MEERALSWEVDLPAHLRVEFTTKRSAKVAGFPLRARTASERAFFAIATPLVEV
jgi:hypothetical protein